MARRSQQVLIAETVGYIRDHLSVVQQMPRIAVICGSGLGGLSEAVSKKKELPYGDVPNFPTSTVPGHAGKLVIGTLGKNQVPVILMVGRFHFYEGHELQTIALPIRVFKALGVETLIVTNAAGGLNPDYDVGDLMLLSDHINIAGLSGLSALRGENDDKLGPRFPALSDAYDLELRVKALRLWRGGQASSDSRRRLHEGVYAFVGGPTYETRAESRLLHQLGADVVGMSTVPEVIVARHCGLRVLALSLVTNRVVMAPAIKATQFLDAETAAQSLHDMNSEGKANHEEVIAAGHAAAKDVELLISNLLDVL